MKPLYIFDIDGTLADLTHRLHYIAKPNPRWDKFNASISYDTPIQPTITTCQVLREWADVWYFTGRMDIHKSRVDTEAWLSKHVIGGDPNVTMRALNDTRPDDIIKQEMLDRMLDEDRNRLVAVFDDRQRVVDMWRRNNVTCYQVAPGDY